MKQSILITKRVYPEAVDFLRERFDVDYAGASGPGVDASELLERAKGKQAIVSQLTDRFSADVIAQLEGVKVIANVAVGYDNIDIAAATKAGIVVTNTPDVLTETTADFAFALLMAAARRVVEANQFLLEGKWDKWAIDLLVGRDVWGRTAGIFGMGRIGQAFARRCRGFSMRVLYNDAKRAPEVVEQELGLEFVSKEDLLRQADFVSLHVPLLPETKKLIGAPELKMMKPTAVLVNTARGPVVDEEAVADALADGTIAFAGLDVFEQEPKVNAKLLTLKNAVLAPHIASASVDTRREMSLMAARNAAAVLDGRRPDNLVNRELYHT